MQKKQFLWKILALIGLAVIAGAIVLLYVFVLKPQPPEGVKNVEFTVVVQAGDVNVKKTYHVMTEAGTLGEMMKHIDEEAGLQVVEENVGFGPMLTGLFGYKANFDNNGEYYWLAGNVSDPGQLNSFSKAFVNDKELLSANVGADSFVLEDGKSYLCMLVNNDTFTGEDNSVTLAVEETAELFDGEKADTYRNDLAQAKSLLITVCCVAGAAFVALSALLVVEAVKAKKL